MSRGFVKEDDLELAGTDVPERPLSPHPNYVTPAGYAQLQQQLTTLENARNDLLKNKEAPSAQQQLTVVNRDLRYFTTRLESAIVSDGSKTNQDAASKAVLFGNSVLVEDKAGNKYTYHIVGEDEADIKANKISWVSPLASALLKHKVGDSVLWKRPAGDITLTILDIF